MRFPRGIALLAATFLLVAGALACPGKSSDSSAVPADPETLYRELQTLRPLHRPLPAPGPGDWLASHPETGQTFQEYRACDPTLPRGERSFLYVQPIGPFTVSQRGILDRTTEFLGLYFQLPTRRLPDRSLREFPAEARRRNPYFGQPQLNSDFILMSLLKPTVPKDAAAVLAITSIDLWPGPGWNYVFGEATLEDRVGVWSIARYGDPGSGDAAFRLCLLRTLKTATHETAHMFSFRHCTAWACNLSGSNSLEESDRLPLTLCPECLAKLCWAMGANPRKRFKDLAEFCEREGLLEEAARYNQSRKLLR